MELLYLPIYIVFGKSIKDYCNLIRNCLYLSMKRSYWGMQLFSFFDHKLNQTPVKIFDGEGAMVICISIIIIPNPFQKAKDIAVLSDVLMNAEYHQESNSGSHQPFSSRNICVQTRFRMLYRQSVKKVTSNEKRYVQKLCTKSLIKKNSEIFLLLLNI